jgi:Ion channel
MNNQLVPSVMTTIGYGNNSPESVGGRAMVYTLGFLALILFGAVSSRAAFVITSLLDDFLIRTKLRRWVCPKADALLWGSAYFLYLVPLGAYYIAWQSQRLGPLGVTGLSNGYWFGYVSMTTARAEDRGISQLAMMSFWLTMSLVSLVFRLALVITTWRLVFFEASIVWSIPSFFF